MSRELGQCGAGFVAIDSHAFDQFGIYLCRFPNLQRQRDGRDRVAASVLEVLAAVLPGDLSICMGES